MEEYLTLEEIKKKVRELLESEEAVSILIPIGERMDDAYEESIQE